MEVIKLNYYLLEEEGLLAKGYSWNNWIYNFGERKWEKDTKSIVYKALYADAHNEPEKPGGDSECTSDRKKVRIITYEEAMQIIDSHAEEWKIDPHKVGVIGFSAGGHLAASLSVHNDSLTRPDFSILFYPVISCHVFTKSRTRLIGETFTKEQEDYFSTEDHINSLTPPTFFVMSSTDTNIVTAGAIKYIERLMLNHVYTEAHFFPEGKHGFCFKQEFPFYEDMTMLLARFLKHQAKRTDE